MGGEKGSPGSYGERGSADDTLESRLMVICDIKGCGGHMTGTHILTPGIICALREDDEGRRSLSTLGVRVWREEGEERGSDSWLPSDSNC